MSRQMIKKSKLELPQSNSPHSKLIITTNMLYGNTCETDCYCLPNCRYTYGRPVIGLLDVKIGICKEDLASAIVIKQERFHLVSRVSNHSGMLYNNVVFMRYVSLAGWRYENSRIFKYRI